MGNLRTLTKNVAIHVVLYKGSSRASKQNYKAEVERYKQFFGAARTTFSPRGVTNYVDKLTRSRFRR